MTVTLLSEMSITQFAMKYKQLGYPQNPNLMKKVYLTDVSTSTLVWSEGPFLVELYIMHPNAVVVPHTHPFENITILLSGSILGKREGAKEKWLTDKSSGRIGLPLPAGEWHGFDVGENGCCFYNISKWDDPAEMDSATVKYIGEPLGPVHKQTLDELAVSIAEQQAQA